MLSVEDAYKIFQLDGFLRNINVSDIQLSRGHAEIEIPLEKNLLRVGEIMNGGAIMALSDAVGGISVMTNEGVQNEFTVSLNVNFLRQISTGPVKFIATTDRIGGKLAFCRIEVVDGNQELCATSIGTWYIVR